MIAAAGFTAGRASGPDRGAEAVARAPSAARRAPPSLSAIELGATVRVAARDAVRDALAERAAGSEGATGPEVAAGSEGAAAARADEEARDEAEGGPEERSAERAAAARKGQAVVDAALRAARWTREDAAALRTAVAAMSRGQRDDLLRRLVPAINRGEVTPAFVGPIF
ncbi:MAG TPA: hypothetical protein VKB80_00825 [Kofleriaceae bacterium]|nr:hypothetical protein [Kofleriaceae bacterium]